MAAWYAESTPLRVPKEALCLEFFYTYKKALAEHPIFDLGNGMRGATGEIPTIHKRSRAALFERVSGILGGAADDRSFLA